MDSWAALEHQLWYKKNLSDEEINSELNFCAEMLYQTGLKMQRIGEKLQCNALFC